MLPQRITFQWHITDQCNLRCKHCYQDNFIDKGVSNNEQFYFLKQFIDLVISAKKEHKIVHAHINFTGGEPFLRNDFLELIEKVKESKLFTFGILSNGYLIEEDKLLRLQKANPRFIQLSLEGSERVNDAIRGIGSYKGVVKAIKIYRKLNLPVMLSFTANASNYTEFGKVVSFGRRHKVYKVWTDRYLPLNSHDELTLTTEQVVEYFRIIKKNQQRTQCFSLTKTIVSSNRALQFLVSGGRPYKCSAGNTLLAILSNGDVLPCRRLPIVIGNLQNDNLVDLYNESKLLKEIKEPVKDDRCQQCYYKSSCGGGLKCLAYAYSKDYKTRDPNCWL